MPGQHSPACKPGTTPHQLRQNFFSFGTDESHIRQIDDQAAPIKLLGGIFPRGNHFGGPWGNQPPFQNQLSLARCLND
jgi:hypothetical protein